MREGRRKSFKHQEIVKEERKSIITEQMRECEVNTEKENAGRGNKLTVNLTLMRKRTETQMVEA